MARKRYKPEEIRELKSEARQLRAKNERLRERPQEDTADARAVIDRQDAAIEELGRRSTKDVGARQGNMAAIAPRWCRARCRGWNAIGLRGWNLDCDKGVWRQVDGSGSEVFRVLQGCA